MTKTRIGIIGGGLAGLTTAFKLSQENSSKVDKVEITLLEATSDIGGRVHTLRNFSAGTYAEAGALSLCDNEYEIQELIKQLKLELVDRSTGAKRYYSSSEDCIPWIDSLPNHYFKKYIIDNISKSIFELHSIACSKLDKISMNDFIKQKIFENNTKIENESKVKPDDHDVVIHALKIGILGLYCDDFSKLSALNGLRWVGQYLLSKKSFSIKGGNDQLPKALEKAAKENGVKIFNNTPVLKINRPSVNSNACVLLTVINSDKQKQLLEFDYVVVAVPLSALQKIAEKNIVENHIEFEPSLPKDQKIAIEKIQYNRSIARIYFEFNQIFWISDIQKPVMATIIDNPTTWIEFHSYNLESKSAILEVHASCEAGRSLHKNNPIESAKKELESIWGDDINQHISSNKPIGYFWSEKFYQQGAYPYLGVGQANYPSLISQKLPSLSFAGEYTDMFSPASMNGAIKSALRVVNEIKSELITRQDLNKKSSHSKTPYSFWLKIGAAGVGLAVGVTAVYKMTCNR